MGKYFTDEQIDAFLKAYVEKYPDAIERMHFVMQHPFRDNDEMMSRTTREIVEIAKEMQFFHEYADQRAKKLQDPNQYSTAMHHLDRDVSRRVAGMLGPTGTYKVEE